MSRWRKHPVSVILFAVTVGLTSCRTLHRPSPALRPPPSALASADSVIQAAIDDELVPGAVLLVGVGGEIAHARAFGDAWGYDFGRVRLQDPVPMAVNTVFDLASLTKVFATTLGVMMLVDQGKVDLDAPVHTYLSSFRGVSKDSVTVRHLLTHSAGLYQWKPLYYHGSTSGEVLAYISQLELAWPVGKERHYSDLGFMLLGYIIEHVSGRPLDAFLEAELYEPLGLEHTGYLPQLRGISGFAATSHGNPFEYKMVADDDFGYQCDENVDDFTGWRYYTLVGEVNDGNAFYGNEGVAGHAGLFSDAEDLNVLLNLVLNGGEYDGDRFFGDKVAEEFLAVDRFGNGLGWAMSPRILRVEDLPSGSFGHTGFTGTYALAVPAYDLTVILLTNRQNLDVDASGNYNSVNPLRAAVAQILVDAVREPG